MYIYTVLWYRIMTLRQRHSKQLYQLADNRYHCSFNFFARTRHEFLLLHTVILMHINLVETTGIPTGTLSNNSKIWSLVDSFCFYSDLPIRYAIVMIVQLLGSLNNIGLLLTTKHYIQELCLEWKLSFRQLTLGYWTYNRMWYLSI